MAKELTKEQILAKAEEAANVAKEKAATKIKKMEERAERERLKAEERERKEAERGKKEAERAKKEAERERKAEEREARREEAELARAAREEQIIERKERVRDLVGAAICDKIQFDANGNPAQRPSNVLVVMKEHLNLQNRMRKNTFTGKYELDNVELNDENVNEIVWDVANVLDWHCRTIVESALVDMAKRNQYHPILEKLETIVWDGKSRLETFFINAVGADDTPANREASFKWLCAMYRRVKTPGSWFDAYIVLQDKTQGTGKSKVFESLGRGLGIRDGNGDLQNYSITNAKPDLLDKDSAMRLNLAAVCEFDEAEKMKYTNLEQFKTFITQYYYTVRLPYDKHVSKFNVHCVYAVTTNDDKFLTDTTTKYERRAWVMRCHGEVHLNQDWWEEKTGENAVQQVWAEAKWWDEHQAEVMEKFGWRIDGQQISFLSEKNAKLMEEVQQGAKTYEEDDAVINGLESMFNKTNYTKEWFASAEDFKMEFDRYRTTVATDGWHGIGCIPVKWVYECVNKLIGGKRSSQYLASVMQSRTVEDLIGKWHKKEHVYYKGTGKQTTCYVKDGYEYAKPKQTYVAVPKRRFEASSTLPEFGSDMQLDEETAQNKGENGFEIEF